jgi:hypothetical protein
MKANRGQEGAEASPRDNVAETLATPHSDGESQPTHRTDGRPNTSVNQDRPQQAAPIGDEPLKEEGNHGQRSQGPNQAPDHQRA